MEQIWSNIQDPSWWFTGLFFLVIGLSLPKIYSNWLPIVWNEFKKFIPSQSRKLSRWNKKRVLISVKSHRQQDMQITWLIVRYWFFVMI